MDIRPIHTEADYKATLKEILALMAQQAEQRCSACWELVPKTLADRMHVCPHCGHVMPRDRNSATVALIDALDTQNTPGTGVAARPKPLPRQRGKSKSVTRETPATTPCV